MSKLISTIIDGKTFLRKKNPYSSQSGWSDYCGETESEFKSREEAFNNFKRDNPNIECLFDLPKNTEIDESEVAEIEYQYKPKYETDYITCIKPFYDALLRGKNHCCDLRLIYPSLKQGKVEPVNDELEKAAQDELQKLYDALDIAYPIKEIDALAPAPDDSEIRVYINHKIRTACKISAKHGFIAALTWQKQQAGEWIDFQSRVKDWLLECLGAEIAKDVQERCDRFIEESLELTQSLGYSADRDHALVDYVFNRPIGEPFQEVGGVMVTLAALCSATDLNMTKDAECEYSRITQPEIIEKIRKKQAAKPTGSALPIKLPQPSQQ